MSGIGTILWILLLLLIFTVVATMLSIYVFRDTDIEKAIVDLVSRYTDDATLAFLDTNKRKFLRLVKERTSTNDIVLKLLTPCEFISSLGGTRWSEWVDHQQLETVVLKDNSSYWLLLEVKTKGDYEKKIHARIQEFGEAVEISLNSTSKKDGIYSIREGGERKKGVTIGEAWWDVFVRRRNPKPREIDKDDGDQ